MKVSHETRTGSHQESPNHAPEQETMPSLLPDRLKECKITALDPSYKASLSSAEGPTAIQPTKNWCLRGKSTEDIGQPIQCWPPGTSVMKSKDPGTV